MISGRGGVCYAIKIPRPVKLSKYKNVSEPHIKLCGLPHDWQPCSKYRYRNVTDLLLNTHSHAEAIIHCLDSAANCLGSKPRYRHQTNVWNLFVLWCVNYKEPISIVGLVYFTFYINTPTCLLIFYLLVMFLRSPQRHREQNTEIPRKRRFFVTAVAVPFYASAIFNLCPQWKKKPVASAPRDPHICYKQCYNDIRNQFRSFRITDMLSSCDILIGLKRLSGHMVWFLDHIRLLLWWVVTLAAAALTPDIPQGLCSR